MLYQLSKNRSRKQAINTKQLISQKLKGKMKSPEHIERIRTGMQNYWKTVEDNTDTEEHI